MVVAYRFPSSENEPELVVRAQSGDDEAFSLLMTAYSDTVRRLVRRFVPDTDDASDVEQETWIRAFSKIGTLRDIQRFRPWLKSIARNSALNFLSEGKRQDAHVRAYQVYQDDEVEEFEDLHLQTPESAALSRDNRRRLLEALGALSECDREILHLRASRALSYDAIASELGIARNAAEVRVCRARERLRRLFGSIDDSLSRCGTNPLLISELVDAELDEGTARTLRTHVNSCSECQARYITMQAGQEVYRHWAPAQPPPVPVVA